MKNFFLYFSQPLDSRLGSPCLGASFSLPLFAAVCHMFKRSKWGSVSVCPVPPYSLFPKQLRWVFFLDLIFFVSLLPHPTRKEMVEIKAIPGEGSRGFLLTASGRLRCSPVPGCALCLEKKGPGAGDAPPHEHPRCPMSALECSGGGGGALRGAPPPPPPGKGRAGERLRMD